MTSNISELPKVVSRHDAVCPASTRTHVCGSRTCRPSSTWPSCIATAARAANPAWLVQSSGLSQPVSGAARSSTEVESSTTRDRAVDRAREPLGGDHR